MAGQVAESALPRKGRRDAAGASPADSGQGVLGARSLAYLIDSVLLAIISVAFVAAGALFMLIESDWGRIDTPDSARWGFVYASLLTVPAWASFNLLLLARRGQTAGQYIIGVRVAREDGGEAGLPRLLLYLLALNPLVFHPWLAVFWALLAFVALSITENNVLVLGSLAVAVLCLAAPVVALLAATPGGGRRALHDRVAGTKVVRVE
ncbi:MAG TPA: RDD family protein [Dehalococcoidia bacterium]|nr:RDD family protein [Dehalococcoidia bacterium]